MTTATAIRTIKTVRIEFTTAPVIRSVARRDIPEFGLTEGQCFYMARSSKNNGDYYLLTWDYERIRWTCSCPATTPNCRHVRAVAKDCAKQHTVNSYKPKYDAVKEAQEFIARVQREKAAKETANNATKWGSLVYDEVHYQAKERHAKIMNDAQAFSIECDRKRASLYASQTPRLELAPSGNLVPMR